MHISAITHSHQTRLQRRLVRSRAMHNDNVIVGQTGTAQNTASRLTNADAKNNLTTCCLWVFLGRFPIPRCTYVCWCAGSARFWHVQYKQKPSHSSARV
ncbi:hypothetical protein BaRGS_00038168 [Batillaria attramentaria]|uniref:Uncharacterized protein n=1 Tax=Batillaria attramentaria TaxID=370345 RepID=A0ABD0J7E3_9CAEN